MLANATVGRPAATLAPPPSNRRPRTRGPLAVGTDGSVYFYYCIVLFFNIITRLVVGGTTSAWWGRREEAHLGRRLPLTQVGEHLAVLRALHLTGGTVHAEAQPGASAPPILTPRSQVGPTPEPAACCACSRLPVAIVTPSALQKCYPGAAAAALRLRQGMHGHALRALGGEAGG